MASLLKRHNITTAQKVVFAAICCLFVVWGINQLRSASAATSVVSAEPEKGMLSSGAVTGNDSAASGGAFVRFGQSAQTAVGGRANTLWMHMNSTPISSTMLTTEAKRRKVIVLNAWESSYIAPIKAANPSIKVLVYKDLSSTRDYDCTNGVDSALLPTGVGYCYALSQHPEWFLKDTSGKRLMYSGYAGHWQMDIGNAAYQQQWITNVRQELVAKNWDGVFMDNALFACDQYHSGVCPALYTTNTAIQSAYKAMFAVTYPSLQSAGKLSIANMANARLHPGLWNAYLQNLHGGFDEFWLVFSPGNYLAEYGSPSIGWKAQVDEIAAAEAAGKIAIVQSHTAYTDTAGFNFALSSYFMAAKGRAVYGDIGAVDGYGDPSPWQAAYDWNLGSPLEDMTTLGNNVFRRKFTCGQVLVNAHVSSTYTATLDRSYLNMSGATVSSVNLPKTSSIILRIPSCQP